LVVVGALAVGGVEEDWAVTEAMEAARATKRATGDFMLGK